MSLGFPWDVLPSPLCGTVKLWISVLPVPPASGSDFGTGPEGASTPRPPPWVTSLQGDLWCRESFMGLGLSPRACGPPEEEHLEGSEHKLPPAASSWSLGQAFLSFLSLFSFLSFLSLSAMRSGETVKQLSTVFFCHLLHQFREQGARAAEVDTSAPGAPSFPVLPPALQPSPARSRAGTEDDCSPWPHLGPILASPTSEFSPSKGQGRIYDP